MRGVQAAVVRGVPTAVQPAALRASVVQPAAVKTVVQPAALRASE